MTNQIFNTENINQVDFIQGRKGTFRAVVKVQAGFMTIVDAFETAKAIDVFRNFKKGALQTIQYKAEGSNNWLTVFARKGNKVILMDTELFLDMVVGDINQNWSNTNLYSQANYNRAGARTWADKAFVSNNIIAGVDFTETLNTLASL